MSMPVLHCPRAAALEGQFTELFMGRPASSLAALFAVETDTSWQPFLVPYAPCVTDTVLHSCSSALF